MALLAVRAVMGVPTPFPAAPRGAHNAERRDDTTIACRQQPPPIRLTAIGRSPARERLT
jgi:hypothetical protein